jgi:hypothetical protein
MIQRGKTVLHKVASNGSREIAFKATKAGAVAGGVYWRRDNVEFAGRWIQRTLKAEFHTVEALTAHLTAKGYVAGNAPRVRRAPSLAAFEAIMDRGAVDLRCGCTVEPDGRCCHGNESPLLTAGLI